MDIWVYTPMNLYDWALQKVGPEPLPQQLFPKESKQGDVIELDAYRKEAWWAGYAACESCAHLVSAVIKGEEPPATVPCPRCRRKSAVPEAHWFASAEIGCQCGNTWKVVIMKKTEILPVSATCGRCGGKTSDIRPWPCAN